MRPSLGRLGAVVALAMVMVSRGLGQDTNNNGIPDSWEMQYLGNLSYGATADPGGVGRTILQSYQQGLSPWPSPTVASGLQAWYRADQGVVADSNNNVSQWTDISGGGFHVYQAAGSNREPLLVSGAMNGNPAVKFTPQQVLTSPQVENLEDGGNDVSVITVIIPSASQGYASTIFSWGTDGNVPFGISSNATNSYLMYWAAGNGSTLSTVPLAATAGQVQVISEVKSGTTATAYLNGATVGLNTVASTMAATNATLAMGNAAYPYYGFTGDVAEVLVYNRALSTAERQSIEAALAAKYVNPDSNGNGIPDSWEMQYLGNLGYGADSDPGGVGRTILQSYQQGLSPWPTPSVAGGLQAWYRADKGVVADSNNNVSQWTDLSGSGFHVYQTVNPGKEPLLVSGAMNGNPAVQFTPQQVLTTPVLENLEAGGSDVTVITVVSPSASQGYASTIFSWGTDGNVAYGVTSNATNSYLLYWPGGDGNTWSSPPLSATAGQVQVISEVKGGTTATSYLNGATVGSRTVVETMAATTFPLAMGNSTYPYYGFTGQVAEVLVYNRALSAAERQTVEAALTTKYVNPDSNGNGIPDTWEMKYLGNLSYGANADPGGVGRTLLQSYQQGLSPWPAPTVANGLQAWFRADKGVVAGSGHSVSQWTDVSGSGFHVFQTVDATKQPTLVAGAMNGNPAVQFTPQQVLTTPVVANLEAGANDMTVITVISPSATQGYASTVFSWGTDGNVAYGISSNATNSYLLYWAGGDGNTWSTQPVSATAGQAQVISEVKSGTSATSYLNGATVGTSTVNGVIAPTSFLLAMGNSTYPYYGFTGQVAEVLVYNRALSTSERQSIEAALTAKYVSSDSNGNGIPDNWEMQYLGNLSYGANADPGGVGRTLLQSYQQGLSPWPAPTVATGLQAWYRADKGVVSGSNNNVSQWTDVSGSGYHVFQTVDTTKQPVLVTGAMNGQPAVQFTPQQVLMTPVAENLEAGNADVTVITVVAPSQSQSNASTIFSWGTDGNVAYGVSSNGTNSYLLYWPGGDGNTWSTPPLSATAGEVQVISEVKGGTTATSYLNGAAVGSRIVVGTMAPASFPLAMGNSTYPYYGFTGQIAEVLVYNRALSTSERQSVEAALTAKYVNPDSNGNGIPDSWEMRYLGNLSYGANADPGGVGRTLLQSYQQGLSPWPAPTVPSGLQAWYRADEGVVADANDNVSQWTDVSGGGLHVFQTVDPTKEPALVTGAMNGNPAIRFTPQQVLTTPILENLEAGGSDITVIAVISPSASQGGESTVFSWGTDGNVPYGISSNGTNSYLLYWPGGDGNTWSTPPLSATAGQVQVLSEVKGGTTASSYLNGSTVGTRTVVGTMAPTSSPLAMGNSTYPYYGFTGQVAEVLVYNRALSNAERHSVEAALTAKYVNPDSNGNGIPDSWEMQYLGNLGYGANADPGGVGRTLLQSFQQGLSPWPTPMVASGLQAWYRADEGVVADSSNNVSQWTDLSGNGFHVFQTVDPTREPALVPSAMNGHPVVQFTPQQVLTTPVLENLEAGGNDVTVIAVVNPSASQSYASTIFSWGTDGNVAYGLSSNSTNSYLLYWPGGDGNTWSSLPLIANAGQVELISEVKSGTSAISYLNGTMVGTSTVNGAIAATSFPLAMGNSTYPYYGFTGQVAEVQVYNRALSTAERQGVEAVLTTKYFGVNSNAPVLTSATTATGTAGTAFTYQTTATNLPTSFAATGLPSGLVISPANGSISGTPITAGTYPVTLILTNAAGSSTATLTITIYPNSPVVSGMLLWLKSDTGVVADSSGNVSIWRDQSGIGNDAFLATGATPPILVPAQDNGLPVVRFDGPNALSLPYNIMQNAPQGEIIAVVKIGSDPDDMNTLWNFGTGFGTAYYNLNHFDDFGNSDQGVVNVESQAQINQYYVYDTSIDANGTAIYRYNGLPLWTRNGLGEGFIPDPDIGGTGAGNFFGDISEVIIFNRALTSDEQGQVYSYLSSRYNLPGIATAVDAPAITSWYFWTGTVGQPFTFQVTASNNPTSLSATGLPAGLTFDSTTGLITGTPTTDGLSVVTMSASNASGTGSSPFFLTIFPSQGTPSITSATTANGEAGQVFGYQVAASNVPTSYSATGLPSWLSIDPVAGVISGVPAQGQAGSYTITVSASNSYGVGSAQVTITIANADSSPVTSGMTLWLEGDSGIQTQTLNGVPTAVWADQSGQGNNATQTAVLNGAIQAPVGSSNVINGHAVVHFTATAQQYLELPALLSGATTGDLFVVLRSTDSSELSDASYWGAWTFGPNGTGFTNSSVADDFLNATQYSVSGIATDLRSFNLYNSTASATQWLSRLNQTVLLSSTSNSLAYPQASNVSAGNYGTAIGVAYFQPPAVPTPTPSPTPTPTPRPTPPPDDAILVTPGEAVPIDLAPVTAPIPLELHADVMEARKTAASSGISARITPGYTASFFDGDIAEVMLYNRNLSDQERAEEQDYLQAKYNLGGFNAPAAPQAPGGLVSSNATSTSVTLSWNVSTGAAGIVGYQIFANGTLYATTTGTYAELTSLTGGATYNFTVYAVDSLGRLSAASTAVSVTTTAAWPYASDPYGDADGDGVPNYEDARPGDPSVGIMTVTILSPSNGSTVP